MVLNASKLMNIRKSLAIFRGSGGSNVIMVARFAEDKNLNNAMKQLLERQILEYVEASDSYQTTEAFRQFIKKIYDKWTAVDPDCFPLEEERK